jgi:hypothetical protein
VGGVARLLSAGLVMVFHLGKKKPPGFRLAVSWIRFGSSLAGSFRQRAGKIEEAEKREEPVRHRSH